MRNLCRVFLTGLMALQVPGTVVCAEEVPADAVEFFEKQVRPLLLEHCADCHGAETQEAGLRLDRRTAVLRGGDSGPVLKAGDPDASRLIQAVRYNTRLQMPPERKLADNEVAVLTEWVSRGAPWPESPTEGDDTDDNPTAATTVPSGSDHWAFQPVQAPPVPEVPDTAACQTPVDNFIIARLAERGLTHSSPFDRRRLIRRVSFDLIGLPPTYEETEAFANDPDPAAYERLVDRLLASERYGERWGRHWLDVARYADTKGYVGADEGDIARREYPFAYAYRDWVIRAFNNDMPYDQFLIEQIAADCLPEDQRSSLAGLGFFRVGRVFLNNKHDQIDDKIDVLTRGTMGLTVACARCHDHKFEPIPTTDYYALYGVFDSTNFPDDEERKLMLLAESDSPHNVNVFKRGNPATPGEEVPRRFLSVLSGESPRPFEQGSGRLELARAIASRDNPLTARVMVNRIWGHHFGKGLVSSASDFGVRTAAPEHQALLDYLADRFMAEGWSIKKLHRLMVLSNTYRQSSALRADGQQQDPENRLLWRVPRRRLDFEQMRDALLAVSGELDLTMGGPSVSITEEPSPPRRTVYARIDRQNLPSLFRTFDFANPDTHSAGRFETTVPQQGLFLMNHPFVQGRARTLAAMLDQAGLTEVEPRIVRLYERILVRQPSAEELATARQFVEAGAAAEENQNEFGIWPQLAQALLMTNEFLFVD